MVQNTLKILTLAQLSQGQEWRLTLAHDRPEHLIIWITRGQGRLLLHGKRHGIGTHNAIIVPARELFALDLGKQGIGQALVIPDGTDVTMPEMPRLLRIRDAAAMNELTTLLEAAGREQSAARALVARSMDAYGTLISVWVQRQLGREEHAPARRNAAARLSAAYCARVTAHFADTLTMADHAQALGVTATHLTRACKAATGKTAADLLTERILYEARSLLVTTKVPAQDIARHLGFGSAAYFTRFMQHHTNATPTALRKASASLSQVA
ncbi:AraC family transcriptional regulator [uncultured Roseobacter sp.]|uniref:helix-turn-helix domain-containing protein n=1 Tax=uncultured Roseobacter sp. TaxID=114847 RepID=UPI00261D5D0B|nr:AraC family transcriptional regulator [uncultured Roseobacter sp.]